MMHIRHSFIAAAIAVLATAVSAGRAVATEQPNPLLLGITLDTAALRSLSEHIRAPGEVRADAYATALVSPRVASQVVARRAKLGDVVKAGDPLVTLSSVDVAETQGQYIVASQDWARVAALGPQAVSARRYNEALVQRDQAHAKLKAYGLSDHQIRTLAKRGSSAADGTFELLAPQAGRITTDDFMLGERIEPGRALFTLVAEASVWVEARMAPAAAEQVKEGSPVTIVAHGTELTGRVIQRSHQTDEKTRTVSVRIQVPNEKDLLHQGELVECRIETATQVRRLAVPADAIVLLQNQPTVFVRGKQPGQFEPLPIQTGDTHDGWTEVTAGLAEGTAYVSQGAFALKARILRAQLGDE